MHAGLSRLLCCGLALALAAGTGADNNGGWGGVADWDAADRDARDWDAGDGDAADRDTGTGSCVQMVRHR